MKDNRLTLAIIGAGNMACVYARKAKEKNIRTICFAWEEGAIAKDLVDVFFPISIFDKDTIVNICCDNKIDGIVCTTELTIAICGYVAEKLNLNSNDYQLSLNITNKYWVRSHSGMCEYLKHPRYKNCFCIQDASDWDCYPAIVKPASEGGKRGVIVVNNSSELEQAIAYSKAFDKHSNGVVLEEFLMGGQEYSVETLSFKGMHSVIQITEKTSSGPPHCVELAHHQPANLSEKMKTQVQKAIVELLNSVGFLNGPAHTEIKIINERVYLIELNARPGGDFIASTLTQLSTGYDYIGESINIAINKQPEKYESTCANYCGIYFVTKQTSYLQDIFNSCDHEEWLYKKHFETDELQELSHNDCTHTNFLIYCSNKRIELSEK